MPGIEEFANKSNKMVHVSKSPYELSESTIREDMEARMEIQELAGKHLKMANVGTDKQSIFFMNDIEYLTEMYIQALHCEIMAYVFQDFFWGWVGRLAVTQAINGEGRRYQAAAAIGGQISQGAKGFGVGLEEAELKRKDQNMMDRLLNQNKQQQVQMPQDRSQ